MSSPTAALEAAVAVLARAWSDAALPAGLAPADVQTAVDAMSEPGLLAVNDALAALRRQVDGLHASVAAGISRRSRPELGKEGLARKTGHRTAAKLIAAATGGHAGDAARLVQVGEATREREQLSGERAPARHPHVAAAVSDGRVSIAAAAAIIAMLDRVSLRAGLERILEAEAAVVAQAPLLTLDELAVVLRRAEALLDPDGLEPVIEEMHAERSLRISRDRAGMVVMTARLDPETAAPIKAAIESIVTHQLRTSRGSNAGGPAGESAGPAGVAGGVAGGVVGAVGESVGAVGAVRAVGDAGGPAGESVGSAGESAGPAGVAAGPEDGAGGVAVGPAAVAPETRSIPQMQADALAMICRHLLGCTDDRVPAAATTVVVRMPLSALTTGEGIGEIDGIDQPIDAGTARRMAAAASIVPCVLGGDSEILDMGRAKRLFTTAQRLALAERDGGCAFCHLPPSTTEAHHILWWDRDRGPTDLGNGILLCASCHHRVHADGWEIRIDPPPGGDPTGGTVWFIPPSHLDATRTPRLGGRRRFDPDGWARAA
ncbi:DUF222 domain-containing protein [Microbacterium sp. NPDC055910]|uniref:HNH endonuclease n=1 Tax=Microbacterium sp. NPDC055910 TaxID=3345659 RepID=UPI0035E2F073